MDLDFLRAADAHGNSSCWRGNIAKSVHNLGYFSIFAASDANS